MEDSELAELRKQCITSLYLCTDNVSKYLDEEKDAEFAKLQKYVQGYCMQEAEQEVAIQALERAKKETGESNISSLEERFTTHLNSLAERQLNVRNHPYMHEFKKRVELGKQLARQNLDESDLMVTESNDQYIDPITKRPIVDPVKNNVCGHIYEKESIMELITRKSRTKCPVAGCGNRGPILKEHLLSDEELKFRMTLTQHSTMIQERTILDLDDTNN